MADELRRRAVFRDHAIGCTGTVIGLLIVILVTRRTLCRGTIRSRCRSGCLRRWCGSCSSQPWCHTCPKSPLSEADSTLRSTRRRRQKAPQDAVSRVKASVASYVLDRLSLTDCPNCSRSPSRSMESRGRARIGRLRQFEATGRVRRRTRGLEPRSERAPVEVPFVLRFVRAQPSRRRHGFFRCHRLICECVPRVGRGLCVLARRVRCRCRRWPRR